MAAQIRSYRQASCPEQSTSAVTSSDDLSADSLQAHLLEGVSRTFALTIPELPAPLRRIIANAYLLCRIVDTIEDEPTIAPERKRELTREFSRVVMEQAPPEPFAARLGAQLSGATLPAEHELIRNTPAVVQITYGFTPRQRAAVERCVRIMAEGMADFQELQPCQGLRSLPELDRYCYVVAGVVGEMLTELFCDYSPAIARQGNGLRQLAVSFGQGLQMTNILKDLWEDRRRGVCWLPRDVFEQAGFDLDDLGPGDGHPGFERGLNRLIAIAHGHLRNALRYTLLIPKQEHGIRNFCCWAIGMAALTLRKIHKHKDFTDGSQVKISRQSVRITVFASRSAAKNDRLLRWLFRLASAGLPHPPMGPASD